MEIRWSSLAVSDLERIFARIDKENPTAARETTQAIYEGCEALKDFPHRGRPAGVARPTSQNGHGEVLASCLPMSKALTIILLNFAR